MQRDSLFGPDNITFNPSLQKLTRLSERFNLQFRAEFFNVFNRPNYANPGFPVSSTGRQRFRGQRRERHASPNIWTDYVHKRHHAPNPVWIEAALLTRKTTRLARWAMTRIEQPLAISREMSSRSARVGECNWRTAGRWSNPP